MLVSILALGHHNLSNTDVPSTRHNNMQNQWISDFKYALKEVKIMRHYASCDTYAYTATDQWLNGNYHISIVDASETRYLCTKPSI